MTFRTFRLSSRQARRLHGAALALVYFWTFVALGLTHTHGAAGAAARHAAPHLEFAGAPAAALSPLPPAADDDSTCPLCAAAHAATAALAQPPRPAAALLPVRRLATAPAGLAPTRTPHASRSRAPPTGLV